MKHQKKPDENPLIPPEIIPEKIIPDPVIQPEHPPKLIPVEKPEKTATPEIEPNKNHFA